ncbi:MAG: septum formation initiator family protein [Nitrospirota bacterium]|nr:septum formation initiator family protein [Nitrospirota bacterium]
MTTLEKQVNSEVKKKQMIFYTVVILTLLYLSISLVFGDMGIFKYLELSRTRTSLERQIAQISTQNEQLKSQLKSLKDDPFYREKLAREEYGLSRPDEYIFQYDR